MDEATSFDTTKRQTINPMVDEINKSTEPLLKSAMKEFGFELPLAFRLYNQIRFYEEYGKLKLGTSVASKKTLADQFGVPEKRIDDAFNNLTNRYKLGHWVIHDEKVFRNVSRTWMSNARINDHTGKYYSVIEQDAKYYSVIPEVLQRNTKSITAYQLPPQDLPPSESKKKVSESKALSDDNGSVTYGNKDINQVFDYWKQTVGFEVTAHRQANRNAASNLIKKHGVDNVRRLIDGVSAAHKDRFAPQIADFCDLQSKLNQLLLWGKKESNGSGKPKVAVI